MVVVLSQRDKLAMEGDFRRLLPPAARFGTRFVFRQARARGGRPRALRRAPRTAEPLRRAAPAHAKVLGEVTLCSAALCVLCAAALRRRRAPRSAARAAPPRGGDSAGWRQRAI